MSKVQLSVKALKNFHEKRLQILLEAKPDLLAIETIPSQLEMRALLELLAQECPSQAAWISFSCRNEQEISDGTPWKEIIPIVNKSKQIIAVGANCTPPNYMTAIISNIKKRTDKAIIIYPNKGEDWDAANNCWIANGQTTEIDDLVENWLEAGAKMIGGCCRTDLETVRAIRRRI